MGDDSTGWVVGLIAIAIVVVFFSWVFDAGWLYKAYYALSEDTNYDRVDIQKKPHDCEFSAAPFGAKNCHYDRVVTKVLWATNPAGYPIRSFDKGTTWTVHTPGKCDFNELLDCPNAYDPPDNVAPKYITVTGVIIQWNKVQE